MFFYTFLPKLLNMSLTASVVILVVLLLRLCIKKAPKVISYALWGIVLFRLLCPVTLESDFSLFRLFDAPVTGSGTKTSTIEYIPENIVHTENPAVALPVPGISEAINDTLPQGREQLAADPLEAPMAIATYVWMLGVLGMGIYAAVSYGKLRCGLVTASPLRDNIYLADEITSPFVLGLFRPRIYLPSSLEEREQSYIILHEQHHIRRLDHVVKVLAFAALSIHWFNPLVWVAFLLSGRDMEMSCDEAVVKKTGEDVLADYTASLLSLATGKHIIAGMPLAFGEGSTKGRIRNLAKWKKPAFFVVLAAVVVCALLAVVLLTNPVRSRSFPMTGQNIADLEPQRIVEKICNLENLDNGSPLFMNEAVDHWVYLTEEFEWRYHETMPFYYMKNKKTYTAQFVAYKGEYSVTESYEISDQDTAFLFQHYLEALKYLPQEQIKEIAPDADQYYIAFTESGAPSSGYEHVITYTNKGISNEDSWVIHLRVQPLHKTESGSGIGRPDEVIHVFYNHAYEEEPAGEVLQWFDDYHNENFPWDGRREINLDAFPGVTFRWYPEKVEAVVGTEIIPLYSGLPIWNVYFTDLTGDGLPELCSTVSFGSGIIDDRILVYDYANGNGTSYSLENRGYFDYTLSVQNDRLLVTRWVYATSEVSETGYLFFVDDKLQMVPLGSTAELVTGNTYALQKCLYMHPASSQMGVPDGSSFAFSMEQWEWQEFPYTDSEWRGLFTPVPGNNGMKNIHELYKEILYLPLSEESFLLNADGALLLVDLRNHGGSEGIKIWSIYSLAAEEGE